MKSASRQQIRICRKTWAILLVLEFAIALGGTLQLHGQAKVREGVAVAERANAAVERPAAVPPKEAARAQDLQAQGHRLTLAGEWTSVTSKWLLVILLLLVQVSKVNWRSTRPDRKAVGETTGSSAHTP